MSDLDAPPVYDSALARTPATEEARAAWRYRPLLWQLVLRDIKTRYKRSVLGVAWVMLNPLATMAVLAVVFSHLFRFEIDDYPTYVLSGLVVWGFVSQSTVAAMTELMWGGSLLGRIYVPRAIFGLAATGSGLVNLLLAMVPLAVIMVVTDVAFTPALAFVPVAIVLVTLFTLGLGLLLSSMSIFFLDVVHTYQVVVTMWFYLTPILYPLSILPEDWTWIVHVNPMYYLLEVFRLPIHAGVLPPLGTIAIATVLSVGTLLVGWVTFARKADQVVYRV